MNRLGRATCRLWERALALAFFVGMVLPTPAWSQPDSTTSSSSAHSSTSTTTTTVTSPEFVSDWRFWAAVGAVLLVILIIAVSRGRGGDADRTTIVK